MGESNVVHMHKEIRVRHINSETRASDNMNRTENQYVTQNKPSTDTQERQHVISIT